MGMSIHIDANPDDVAPRVLLPGDPLRARFIAENYLENSRCYNEVRGMYGYTGTWKGIPVSVQGTGMGMPSHAIYVHELINKMGARVLIRVGSCGALQPGLKLRDLVMGLSACTDSAMAGSWCPGMNFAPAASWEIIKQAHKAAEALNLDLKAGSIMSSDSFYHPDEEIWKTWARMGVLAVEMEAAALYTLAARFNVRALCLLTVSDSLVTQEKTSPEEREKTFTQMMELALETCLSVNIEENENE